MIDHSMVRPELTDEQVAAGCDLARHYQVASVSVRPCDVDLAVRMLNGSGVAVGTVAGFPHGSTTTAVKLYEIRDVLRRGAKEVDMVLNIARLLSRQFQFVETELLQAAEECHKQGALLKVIFENAYLTDELKIVACRISARAEVDFVKTSTAFGARRLHHRRSQADARSHPGAHRRQSGRWSAHSGKGSRGLPGGLFPLRRNGHGGHTG